MRHAIRFELDFLQVKETNEGSPDEPYLWVQFGALDATCINVADPRASSFRFSSQPGSHGNLGSDSDDMSDEERVEIPARIGRWDTTLETELVTPEGTVDLADHCFVFAVLIAMEEDATPDATAEEARRRLLVELRRQLDGVLGQTVAEIRGGAEIGREEFMERLQELDQEALIRPVREAFTGPVINTVIVTLIFVPFLTFAAMDPDDYIGRDIVALSLGDVLAAGPEGRRFERWINLSTPQEQEARARFPNGVGPGTYRVVGRATQRTVPDFIAPAMARAGDGRPLHLVARSSDGRMCVSTRASGDFGRWSGIPNGVMKSAPAAAVDGGGSDLLVYGLGMDDRLWFARSRDGGRSWNPAWAAQEVGTFTSAPALARGNDGQTIHLAARGRDNGCWYARSLNGGRSWDPLFRPLAGVFTSAIGMACSRDGREVHLAGRGQDGQIWRARSFDGGDGWEGWLRISGIEGGFRSAPAIACSANGHFVHYVARDTEGRFRHCLMNRDAGAFETGWEFRTPDGRFLSSPAVVCDADGSDLVIAGIGMDRAVWVAEFADFGQRLTVPFHPVGNRHFL